MTFKEWHTMHYGFDPSHGPVYCPEDMRRCWDYQQKRIDGLGAKLQIDTLNPNRRAHINNLAGRIKELEAELVKTTKYVVDTKEAIEHIAYLAKNFPDVMVTAPEDKHLMEMREIKKIANKLTRLRMSDE